MINYMVRYRQEFMGEILVDSYQTCVKNESDLFKIETALYSDPHVIEVDFIKMNCSKGE